MDYNTSYSNFTNSSVPVTEKLTTTDSIALCQLIIVFLFGTSGNGVVIYVFAWKKRKSRRRFESLLLILGVTDFCASLFVPALFMYGTATQYKQWHFGYFGCKFITSLFPVSITISQGILVLISFERYKTITNPLGARLSRSFIVNWLLTIVVIALLLVTPFTYTLQLVNDKKYGINTCIPTKDNFDVIFLFSLGNIVRDFAATSGMFILNILTAKSLHKEHMFLNELGMKKRLENANKARKMLMVVVVVFSICVLPVDVFQAVFYTLIEANVNMSKKVYEVFLTSNTFLTILQISNSATNIFIYSRMHKDFTRNLFACYRKGNELLRESFNRVTFRSTRSESMVSLPGQLIKTPTPDDNDVFSTD